MWSLAIRGYDIEVLTKYTDKKLMKLEMSLKFFYRFI